MKPNVKDRTLESHGVEESREFGISIADSAHIMTILRDTLYSDKVLAVLREYSSNAWDAHREVNKDKVPIKVTLPTEMDPTLTIRDFGPGLSPEDAFNVYTQYGASTKRSNDTTVGMLGIGCKSAFAYADSFTITSFYGGKKRIYIAVLDQSEKGILNLLHEEDSNETGVMIQVAVKPQDINEFTEKARQLYTYFNPRPDINTDIPELPSVMKELKSGVIYDEKHFFGDGEWVAVMGCVSYKIDLNQIRDFGAEEGVPKFLRSISGALYFDIGDVQINASREGLKYSDHTKKTLLEKFNALVDEYVSNTLEEIEKQGGTPWSRRVHAQLLGRLNLPVPKDAKEWIGNHVDIGGKIPKSIVIEQDDKTVSNIRVAQETRLLIRDDNRPYKGYQLTGYDYIVRRTDGSIDWKTVEAELNHMLADRGMTGLPMVFMSTLDWHKPYNPKALYFNIKHRRKIFELIDQPHAYRSKKSDNWKPVEEHEPSDEDVFVIINGFAARGVNLWDLWGFDSTLLDYFYGVKMPRILGYKTTEKKPIDPKDIIGTPYQKWSDDNLKKILSIPKAMKMLQEANWVNIIGQTSIYHTGYKKDPVVRDFLKKNLGARHPITVTVLRHQAARKRPAVKDAKKREVVEALRRRVAMSKIPNLNEAQKELDNIFARYPLIKAVGDGLSCIWMEHDQDWMHYIRMIDRALTIGAQDHGQLAAVHTHP